MNPKYLTYVDKKYEKFIREKGCLICGQRPIDGHHMRHGKNNSYLLTPLCREHHSVGPTSYHRLEHEAFEDKHGIQCDWAVIKFLMEYISTLK